MPEHSHPATPNPAASRQALLLVGSRCPHCPAVLTALTELVKDGELAQLEVVNLEQAPARAAELGVRSVPWVRIGLFELEGVHSKTEYQHWIQLAAQPDGLQAYMETMLGEGQVSKIIRLLESDHSIMRELFALMQDADAKINLRLGIGVIMEEFAAAPWFVQYIPELEKLCRHDDARVRADACHNLALTENPQVLPLLQQLLQDSSAEVRELAADGIAALQQT